MLIFRDLELDFDLFDADTAEAYEAALKTVAEAENVTVKNEGFSAAIRRQCNIIFDFFDDMFGEGFHLQVFGERANLTVCLEAFEEFTELAKEQRKALEAKTAEIQARSGNRATRRPAAPRASAKAASKK